MPSGLGRLTHVGIGKETVWGTAVAASVFTPILSVEPTPELEDAEDEGIYGTFGKREPFKVLNRAKVALSFDARPQILCHHLRSMCGPPISTLVNGSIYDHVFRWPRQTVFADACRPNPYSIEIFQDFEPIADSGAITVSVVATAKTYTRSAGSFLTDGFAAGMSVTMSGFTNAGNNGIKIIDTVTATVITVTVSTGLVDETGDGNERVVQIPWAKRYAGCGLNSLSLALGSGDKILRGDADWIAKGFPVNIAKSTPTYPAPRPWLFNQNAITVGAAPHGELDEFTLNLSDELEGRHLQTGSTDIAELLPNDPVATLSGTSYPRSPTEYNAFIARTLRAVVFTLAGEIISSSYYHTLTITMPAVRYKSYSRPTSGPARMTGDWEADVLYDPSSAYAIELKVRTNIANTELA